VGGGEAGPSGELVGQNLDRNSPVFAGVAIQAHDFTDDGPRERKRVSRAIRIYDFDFHSHRVVLRGGREVKSVKRQIHRGTNFFLILGICGPDECGLRQVGAPRIPTIDGCRTDRFSLPIGFDWQFAHQVSPLSLHAAGGT
jgi:hypothetical protein